MAGFQAWSALCCAVACAFGVAAQSAQGQVDTTINDFFLPGTQPQIDDKIDSKLTDLLVASGDCSNCHQSDTPTYPYNFWKHSMMGQASRDPIFFACLDIANADVPLSGDLCIRCHSPNAWLSGRSVNEDTGEADALNFDAALGDFDGVTCSLCHRMMDPFGGPGEPDRDVAELAVLTADDVMPASLHSGTYAVDREDFRRGPYQVGHLDHGNEALQAAFFRQANFCGTCHDVSNPAYERQPDGTYDLGEVDAEHPTQDKYDMFPIERTFSEWSQSEFAKHDVSLDRFGGNDHNVSTCQDCHMPKMAGVGCDGGASRPDNPLHEFNGANSWVLKAILAIDGADSGLDNAGINASIDRAKLMLANASDMQVWQTGTKLHVRIINQSGHKLPTGYPEGRAMWINIKWQNSDFITVAETGAYDPAEGVTDDTTIFEAELGYDDAAANAIGLPIKHRPGEDATKSFHFVANNVYLKDNRIPPRGFTNVAFDQVQAAPVEETYADGQYWFDAEFDLPNSPELFVAEISVFHQTTTPKYIKFLRDESPTAGEPDSRGQIAYDQWLAQGGDEPVLMDHEVFTLNTAGTSTRAYVDDSATGANNGSSWANAYTTLEAALNADPVAREIWVAVGEYKPTAGVDRTKTFNIPNGTLIYGGFNGNEATLALRAGRYSETILTGEIGAAGLADNSLHVVMSDVAAGPMLKPSLLDGFAVTAGNADGAAGDGRGGGMRITGAGSIGVRNCMFVGNHAGQLGAGIHNESSGIVLIANSVFSGNGDGLDPLAGGGIYNAGQSYLQVVNCSFAANEAAVGGGIAIGDATLVVSNSVFHGNQDSTGDTENAQLDVKDGLAIINYCIVEGWDGSLGGEGNFDEDPLFRDAPGADAVAGTTDDDLRLFICSPAIDAGHSSAIPADILKDFEGFDRRVDDVHTADSGAGPEPIIDKGAFEFGLFVCVGDTNLDYKVDIDDLFEVVTSWGQLAFPCNAADVNVDGVVDIDDLALVIALWGPCPI